MDHPYKFSTMCITFVVDYLIAFGQLEASFGNFILDLVVPMASPKGTRTQERVVPGCQISKVLVVLASADTCGAS